MEQHNYRVEDEIPGLSEPLGEELLRPTRIYVEPVLNLLRDFPISGICHITGGGLTDNLPRILPNPARRSSISNPGRCPPSSAFSGKRANLPEAEMLRTFNNGIGLAVAVAEEHEPTSSCACTASRKRAASSATSSPARTTPRP